MIDSKLRNLFQPMFSLAAKPLMSMGIHPDAVTSIAFIIGISASIFLGLGYIALPIGLLWLSGLLDVLDGTMARLTGKSSKIGAYLDMVFDRMVEASVILAFYFVAPEHALAYLVFFVAVLFNFTTFIIAGALFSNTGYKSMHYDIGLAERTETFLVFTLMMLMQNNITTILMIFNGIIFLTGLIRFIRIINFTKS
jgi:archaetidylinositol phosphate synthase